MMMTENVAKGYIHLGFKVVCVLFQHEHEIFNNNKKADMMRLLLCNEKNVIPVNNNNNIKDCNYKHQHQSL